MTLKTVLIYTCQVWIPVPRVRDSRHHLLGDHDPTLLLSSLCGGLQLVVEELPDQRLYRLLLCCLLHSLLFYKTRHRGLCLNLSVFRLHQHHGLLFLLAHR